MKPRRIATIAILLALAVLLVQAAGTSSAQQTRPSPGEQIRAALAVRNKPKQDAAAKWVGAVDPGKAKLTFFYLNPDSSQHQTEKDKPDGFFHGWRIIRSQALVVNEDKQFILAALMRSIRDSDGDVALCFSPAFGLKIETEADKSVEMAICFHCKQTAVYGKEAFKGFGVDGPAVDDFLALVKKLHLDPGDKK